MPRFYFVWKGGGGMTRGPRAAATYGLAVYFACFCQLHPSNTCSKLRSTTEKKSSWFPKAKVAWGGDKSAGESFAPTITSSYFLMLHPYHLHHDYQMIKKNWWGDSMIQYKEKPKFPPQRKRPCPTKARTGTQRALVKEGKCRFDKCLDPLPPRHCKTTYLPTL